MRHVRLLAPALAITAAVGLAGCSTGETPDPPRAKPLASTGATPSKTATPTPTVAAAWTGITGGSWDWGDAGFNTPVGAVSQQYTVAVTGPPTMTEKTSDTVRVTSPLRVVHVKDGGFGGPIPEAADVFFSPGPGDTTHTMDESYGTQTTIVCDNDEPAVGAATNCTVSFVADLTGVQDSYWQVMGDKVAAWPSQKP